MKFLRKIKAFTLAEVLVSLTIIGVISTLTIPAVVSNTEKRTNAALLRKAVAKLDTVMEQAATESQFSPTLKCFYWKDNETKNLRNSGCVAQSKYDENGLHIGWDTVCPEGVTAPDNLNGMLSQCTSFNEYIVENIKVTKYCDDAMKNGCIPEYSGNDVVGAENLPKQDDETQEQYKIRIKNSVAGCSGWSADSIETRTAFITNDGMIFIRYSNGLPIFAIDVNGKKGPNKFGYDVFFVIARGDIGEMPTFYPGGCEFTQKGGTPTSSMLTGKY